MIYSKGDDYLIHVRLWENLLTKLDQYQKIFNIENEKIVFPEKRPYNENYILIKKTGWRDLLYRLNLYKTKYRLDKLDIDKITGKQEGQQ